MQKISKREKKHLRYITGIYRLIITEYHRVSRTSVRSKKNTKKKQKKLTDPIKFYIQKFKSLTKKTNQISKHLQELI